MHQKFDIMIIGAGIPGLLLAYYLREHFKILILDQALEPSPTSNPLTERVSSINIQSISIFEKMGLWTHFSKEKCTAVKSIRILDALSRAELNFQAADSGQLALSYIIENNLIIQVLLNALKADKQCQIIRPSNLVSIATTEEAISVMNSKGDSDEARLLIGADGAQSWLRSQLNIKLNEKDYQQSAFISSIGIEKPHHNTAFQVFLPTGPLAFLPLPDPNTVSIVWSSQDDLLQLSETELLQNLANKTEGRYGQLTLLSKLQAFPLKMRHAENYIQERIALIGDAAHTIHPLAGQGLNLGIADAACLAEIILQAKLKNRQYFSAHTLKAYQRNRKAENSKMIYAMSAFHHLFTNTQDWLVKARGLGLNCVNKSSLLKRLFVGLAN